MKNLRIACLCFLSLFFANVLSAQSCEDSFHVEGSESAGLHLSVQETFPTMDTYKAIGWIQNQLEIGGRPRGTASYKGSQATLDADVGNHLHFVADNNSKTLTLTLSTTPGKPYDINRGRKAMCGMVSSLKSNDTTGKASGAAAQTAPASRTTTPDNRQSTPPPGTNFWRPKLAFDAVEAQKAMEPGSSTVKGTACALHKSGNDPGVMGEHGSVVLLASNAKVFLYPDTPYTEEAMDLMKKGVLESHAVQISPDFSKFRRETITDTNGDFQFSNLKSGKYVILSVLTADVHGAKTVDDGTNQEGNTIYHNYHTQYSNYAYDDLLRKAAEVKTDGQVVKLDLKPDHFDGILGCHAHIIPHKAVDQRQYDTP